MKRLTGLRYLVPLREGGSLPAVVETDEPGAYVVKFRGAGQGVKALVAELLAAELALLLGLPVPGPALVCISPARSPSIPPPTARLTPTSPRRLSGSTHTSRMLTAPRATRICSPGVGRGI